MQEILVHGKNTMKKFTFVRILASVFCFISLLYADMSLALTSDEALGILGSRSASFDDKTQAIHALNEDPAPYISSLFKALNKGELFFDKKSSALYIKAKDGSYLDIKNKLKFKGKKRNLKKVSINNSLRQELSLIIALNDLNNHNLSTKIRTQNAIDLIGQLDSSQTESITKLRDSALGEDEEFATALNYIIAAADLSNADPKIRNGAMRILEDFNSPVLINRFDDIAKNDPDVSNRLFAKKRTKELQNSQTINNCFETVFFGLSLGSVLVLAAIGLTVTFGVMGVINMAHGELMMIGAYTTYVIQQLMPGYPGIALLLSIPAAFMVSGLVGIAIERGVIRFLYGRPLETLLATFGISLLLQQAVRSIFTALNKNVVIPDFMSGSFKVNEFLILTYNRLYIIIFCLIVFFSLRYFLKKSTLGVQVRAVSQNRAMARNMGIHSDRVNALTFGLGSGIAGLAGVALSQLTNVGPNLGQNYIVDSFLVVVFGGSGNIFGTLAAGMTLGLCNKILEPISGAMLAKIIILVGVILFIQKRPRGLFPQRGRSVED